MYEDHNIKYFIPRIESIKYGEIIMWVNKDSEPHHLISEDIENDKPDGIFNSGIIHPKKCYSKKFDIYTGLIDYYCVIHPAERGFIIINNTLSNITDNTSNIKFNYSNKIFSNTQNQPIRNILTRYVDPMIL